MPNFETFNIEPVVEKKHFEDKISQAFFQKWCDVNNGIVPNFLSRKDWDKKTKDGLLHDREDGKKNLYIPSDLKLWEIISIIEAVDHDTFSEKKERQDEAKNKLLALGETFKNAGVYIAQRLDSVEDGREIARALAEEFYDYGQALVSGEKSQEPASADDIALDILPTEKLDELDKFLAGEELYQSRKNRAKQNEKDNDDSFEEERRKTLKQFFKVSAKAFELKQKSEQQEFQETNKNIKSWENNTPIHNQFINKIEKAMAREIETPKREMEIAIFRRGLEKLVTQMKEPKKEEECKGLLDNFFKTMKIDLPGEQRKIADVLNIKQLKSELDEIKKSGDLAKISIKEHEIANKIHEAVSKFPKKLSANNPSEMVKNQYINCVGASTLGGALMREAGLNYLVGDVPGHSVLFLVREDGKVELRDMLHYSIKQEITDKMMRGANGVHVDDIAKFAKNPRSEGLIFGVNKRKFPIKLSWVQKWQKSSLAVFEPELGQQVQLLYNIGFNFNKLSNDSELSQEHQMEFLEQSIKAFQQATGLAPNHAESHCQLGFVLRKMNRIEEAIEEFKKAIKFDPERANYYQYLGNILFSLGRYQEAERTYHQAAEISPDYPEPYFGLVKCAEHLGNVDEAEKNNKKLKKFGKAQDYEPYVERSKEIVEEMRRNHKK